MECLSWDKLSMCYIGPDIVKKILGTKHPNWQKPKEPKGIKYSCSLGSLSLAAFSFHSFHSWLL